MAETDPLPLAQALIRCASVTPADEGAQDILADALRGLGFTVRDLTFGGTRNLFARFGTASPHVCFAGHTDVVPPGTGWRHAPFEGAVEDGVLYGRGACDMKGAIAAFVAACARVLESDTKLAGSLSLLITGDEEGTGRDGTRRVLEVLAQENQIPDGCLVGEPTNPGRMGEMIKIGRRGSLNATVTVRGIQGHVAYPDRADNPVHRLVRALNGLIEQPLDSGTEWFQPSSLQISSIDVGNLASNVIPGQAEARLNIRFNDTHTGATLEAWLRDTLAQHAPDFDLQVDVSGEPFLTNPGPLTHALAREVNRVTGLIPKLDTGGGTSDARFIARYCPVAEFGLVGATMHRVDEAIHIQDLYMLTDIYAGVIRAALCAA